MAGQQTQELDPRVPRTPDDPGLHRISIHELAYSCIGIVQWPAP
jgi:hypothetical protein